MRNTSIQDGAIGPGQHPRAGFRAPQVVDDISHEGRRLLLQQEGVSFQAAKSWKQSNDPNFEAKKNRILQLCDIADGKTEPGPGDPLVVLCMDEFGPLNLQPHPGRQWAGIGGKHEDHDRAPRRRRRATYTRPHGVRHLLAAYDLTGDKLYGHMKKRKCRTSSSSSAATSGRCIRPRFGS